MNTGWLDKWNQKVCRTVESLKILLKPYSNPEKGRIGTIDTSFQMEKQVESQVSDRTQSQTWVCNSQIQHPFPSTHNTGHLVIEMQIFCAIPNLLIRNSLQELTIVTEINNDLNN